MIPTLLLLGLLAGALLGHRPLCALALTGATSLLWGLSVGAADESVSTFAGATALASLNVFFGAVVGAALRRVATALLS